MVFAVCVALAAHFSSLRNLPMSLLPLAPLRAVLFAACWLASSAALAVSIGKVDLPRPEGVRHYLLAQPDRSASGKRPLVILLHGHGGNAAQLLGQRFGAAPLAQWLTIAERENLLLAAPDGIKGADGHPGWNDCRADADNNPAGNDTALIGAIIDREIAEHGADPARVYVMGMSNGGMMTFRLASEIGSRLAAFAAVSASMAQRSACPQPAQPLTALLVAGTADPLVPYAGGEVHFLSRKSRGSVLGIEQVAAFWRRRNGLSGEPVVTPLPHRDPADPTRATRLLWGADSAAPQVELMRIEQGGHIEPSIAQRARRAYLTLVGPQNGDFEVAEEAWRFFRDKRAALRQ